MEYLTVIPAYGRDYKTARAARADWHAGKDWIVADVLNRWSGKPINISDAAGYSVTLRFCGLRKTCDAGAKPTASKAASKAAKPTASKAASKAAKPTASKATKPTASKAAKPMPIPRALQAYDIANRAPAGEVTKAQASGRVLGYFGLRCIDGDYQIDHIPTGYKVYDGMPYAGARRLIRALHAQGEVWNFKSAKPPSKEFSVAFDAANVFDVHQIRG